MHHQLFQWIVFSLIILAPSLRACEGFYLGLFGGVNMLQKDHEHSENIVYKTGYACGGTAGYGFCNNVRIEGEFAYRRNNIKHFKMCKGSFSQGHRRSYSFMANCLYDFNICYPVTPYLGIGAGADRYTLVVDLPGDHSKEHEDCFALQGIAGFSYPFYDYTDMWIDYRYHWGIPHRYNHTFTLGIRYIF